MFLALRRISRVLVVTHIRKYEPLKEAVTFFVKFKSEDDRRFSVETSLPSFLRMSFDVQISQCPTFLTVIMQIPDCNFSIFCIEGITIYIHTEIYAPKCIAIKILSSH